MVNCLVTRIVDMVQKDGTMPQPCLPCTPSPTAKAQENDLSGPEIDFRVLIDEEQQNISTLFKPDTQVLLQMPQEASSTPHHPDRCKLQQEGNEEDESRL